MIKFKEYSTYDPILLFLSFKCEMLGYVEINDEEKNLFLNPSL